MAGHRRLSVSSLLCDNVTETNHSRPTERDGDDAHVRTTAIDPENGPMLPPPTAVDGVHHGHSIYTLSPPAQQIFPPPAWPASSSSERRFQHTTRSGPQTSVTPPHLSTLPTSVLPPSFVGHAPMLSKTNSGSEPVNGASPMDVRSPKLSPSPSKNLSGASESPVSVLGSRNALDVLIRAAAVERDRARELEQRRLSNEHPRPSVATPLPVLSYHVHNTRPPVPVHKDDGPDLMQRALSGSSRRVEREMASRPRLADEEDADEWLLNQLNDERPGSSPPASPASSAAPSRAPSRAAASKKGSSRSAKNDRKRRSANPIAMDVDDVDDELLSLVGEGQAGPSHHRHASESSDADLLLASASSPHEAASMPPPPEPAAQEKGRSKAPSKKKAPAKPRTILLPKRQSKPSAKVKAAKDAPLAASPAAPTRSHKKGAAAAARKVVQVETTSRSRSASTMPSVTPKAVTPEPVSEEEEDDKLYCVCQQRWDDGAIMIGCDLCEGWYHPRCIQMENHWVDLVDQFICPNCIVDPVVTKRTTWKQRCLNGLSEDSPSAVAACHKPVRGDGSKFCSDACGMAYMRKRIDKWAIDGGNRAHLWESVKGAPRREGTVAVVPAAPSAAQAVPSPNGPNQALGDHRSSLLAQAVVQPAQNRIEREVMRLRAQLSDWTVRRRVLEHALGTVDWRMRLLARASARADTLGACGWDQRLCYGEEECEEFGAGVLESYDVSEEGDEQMDEFGAWWCADSRKCARHSGWQKLRTQDLTKEKDMKEDALHKLNAREADNNQRIRDLLTPQDTQLSEINPNIPKAKIAKPAKTDEDVVDGRGKKRKAG